MKIRINTMTGPVGRALIWLVDTKTIKYPGTPQFKQASTYKVEFFNHNAGEIDTFEVSDIEVALMICRRLVKEGVR